MLGEDDDEDDDDDVSPAAVQQQAIIQEDAPAAAADTVVDTIQADAATPEVYEDEQQFGKQSRPPTSYRLSIPVTHRRLVKAHRTIIHYSSLSLFLVDQIDNDISGQTNVKDDVSELSAAKPAADDGK